MQNQWIWMADYTASSCLLRSGFSHSNFIHWPFEFPSDSFVSSTKSTTNKTAKESHHQANRATCRAHLCTGASSLERLMVGQGGKWHEEACEIREQNHLKNCSLSGTEWGFEQQNPPPGLLLTQINMYFPILGRNW